MKANKTLSFLDKHISKLECYLIALCSSSALILACYEMFMRYFFPRNLADWTSEVVVYFITAAVFSSGGQLVKEEKHVYADLFISNFKPFTKRIVEIVFCMVGVVFGIIMVYSGSEVVEFSYRLDEKSDSSLQFPVYIYYLIIPLSFFFITFHYSLRCYNLIFNYKFKLVDTLNISALD